MGDCFTRQQPSKQSKVDTPANLTQPSIKIQVVLSNQSHNQVFVSQEEIQIGKPENHQDNETIETNEQARRINDKLDLHQSYIGDKPINKERICNLTVIQEESNCEDDLSRASAIGISEFGTKIKAIRKSWNKLPNQPVCQDQEYLAKTNI